MRYLALLHFSEGHSRTAIANMFKVCRISVNRWISTYLAQGLSGLDDTANPSRPATLSTVQQAKLKVFVQHQSLSEQGGRLVEKDIGHYIQTAFGVAFKQANIYRLLHQLGISWMTTRSHHPKQSEATQGAFKNFWMATEFRRHALVIMDGAGWHQQDFTDDFDNLTLLKLPP